VVPADAAGQRTPVPAFPEAVFCFITILMLQFVAMKYMTTDLDAPDPGSSDDAADRSPAARDDRMPGRLHGDAAHDQSAGHVSAADAVPDCDGDRRRPGTRQHIP
jgi:hypothetical protein